MEYCLHCHEPLTPARQALTAPAHAYCCTGCEAAAAFCDPGERFSEYDQPELLETVAQPGQNGLLETDILIEGIRCAACVADIEKRLRQLPGLPSFRINIQNRIATLHWQSDALSLSRILQTIAAAGYEPHPLPLDAGLDAMRREDRRAILRLGLAGLGAMQVMMLSLGLYFGPELDLTPDIRQLLSWAAMLLATPVVLYSGLPFFTGAIRDLRHRRVGMDVPVAIAIGAAYGMSVLHTLTGEGEIWFDSACMFVFFLSLGRHVEANGRRRAQQGLRALVASQPQHVTLIEEDSRRIIPLNALKAGMRLLIRPGDTFPADGSIVKGSSTVDESLLTGESRPQERNCGDPVLAGSVNRYQALEICAERVGADTTRAHLMRLLRRAESRKPAVALLADRIAGHFVMAVLLIASLTALVWYHLDSSRAFEITLAVLVVTCPCALSLATPASLSAAAAALARRGLLVTREHTLDALNRITHVVFDKTGTLTDQQLAVSQVRATPGWLPERILSLAAAMEEEQSHPIAEALRDNATREINGLKASAEAGLGVTADYQGHRYALGSPARLLGTNTTIPEDGNTWLVLTEDEKPVGWIALHAQIKPEALTALQLLRAQGLHVQLMSGDNEHAVRHVARSLAIPEAWGNMLPQDKLDAVEALRKRGATVMMVGDGLNDAPVLAGADVSVAMQSGAALAQASADAVLLSGNLMTLPHARDIALKSRRIIHQNLSWAVAYNLLTVPLAVTGLLAPWMAAIGMSASSLIVVGNALRLLRSPEDLPALESAGEVPGNDAMHSAVETMS